MEPPGRVWSAAGTAPAAGSARHPARAPYALEDTPPAAARTKHGADGQAGRAGAESTSGRGPGPSLHPRGYDPPVNLRRKLTWVAVLYFAEGFPYGIAYDVWPVYFRVHGVSLREIGLMSLLFLPYTLKPAWAPFADRVGSRQGWIAACQVGLAALCLAMPFFDAAHPTVPLWGVLLAFTFLSATQDISIDAYAVDVSTPRDSGLINGMRVSLYRAALLFAGGVLLLLADRPAIGWTGVWILAAVLCVASALLALASPRVPREHAGAAALAVGRRRRAPPPSPRRGSAPGSSPSSPPPRCCSPRPIAPGGRGCG